MILEDSLYILLRCTAPETVIESWLNNTYKKSESSQPTWLFPKENTFISTLQNQFPHYSVDEALYAYRYLTTSAMQKYGVFGLIADIAKNSLCTDIRNECLCKFESLINFRQISHKIDPLLFVTAYLAANDIDTNFKRNIFSWSPVIRTDNIRLHHILNRGVSENHFHIGGSSNAFIFSWVCLMNHFGSDRKKEFSKLQMDTNPLGASFNGFPGTYENGYTLAFKAACLRYFLYMRLNCNWVKQSNKETDIRKENEEWLLERLSATSDDCDQYAEELEIEIGALRNMMDAKKEPGNTIYDYALDQEPLPPLDDNDIPMHSSLAVRNYERRLYRALAGEQKFLYRLFLAIFKNDPNIMPYCDLIYAYMLIYCRIRSEIIQVNERLGFGNFQKYQDRKGVFTNSWVEFSKLRTRVAQQSVLSNPQVISFEGRLRPPTEAKDLINIIKYTYEQASTTDYEDVKLQQKVKENAEKKLHYVLHFTKERQWATNNDYVEILKPRNYKLRETVEKQTSAIIEATKISPKTMRLISGIDAASNEIDCQPEVFACSFRHLRQNRRNFDSFLVETPLPPYRITYHAGEDFLDPINGLRSISDAITFCEMTTGDRLGHALALGIDCEEWYTIKKHTVLLQKQTLLDNLTWLHGMMHKYNIVNNSAEDHIQKWFKKLFTEIYTQFLDNRHSILYAIDVIDYYASLNLRGNDPYLYYHNPDGDSNEQTLFEKDLLNADIEPWRIREKAGKHYDRVSNTLYHNYHFNPKMKLESSKIVEYNVPKCIIDTVCALQEKMQFALAQKNIGIECNPSSNLLIGTFKNYTEHPIFRFNNKDLFTTTDQHYNKINPRISVSINTDDMGIFDTSLENEYALIACSLEQISNYYRDENLILTDNIYSWIENIRKNGCEQSFIHIN